MAAWAGRKSRKILILLEEVGEIPRLRPLTRLGIRLAVLSRRGEEKLRRRLHGGAGCMAAIAFEADGRMTGAGCSRGRRREPAHRSKARSRAPRMRGPNASGDDWTNPHPLAR